jgi:hypothetical protein
MKTTEQWLKHFLFFLFPPALKLRVICSKPYVVKYVSGEACRAELDRSLHLGYSFKACACLYCKCKIAWIKMVPHRGE